jgi:hypothetical protein
MTVCIASIHRDKKTGPSIIAASDRRISLFGGWFSDEGRAKFRSIHPEWEALFAGGTEETKLMLDAITLAMKKVKANHLEKVVNCCRQAYAKQRVRLIETQVLPEFDVNTYREYKALRQSDDGLYAEITKAVRDAQENWSLLFAGFDEDSAPHIFVISGPGRVEPYDYISRAAIGTGAVAALFWLSYQGFAARPGIGEAVLAAVWAKFFAERATDVGEQTIVTVMRPNRDYAIGLSDEEVKGARDAWDKLEKTDAPTATSIERKIESTFSLYDAFRGKNKQISQSASRKSEPEK